MPALVLEKASGGHGSAFLSLGLRLSGSRVASGDAQLSWLWPTLKRAQSQPSAHPDGNACLGADSFIHSSIHSFCRKNISTKAE